MPQTRSTQVQTPTNSDAFNLTADLATMAESIPGIVTVANDAAGDTVATNRAASGFAIADSRPLFVYNLATKTIRVKDSAGWRDMNGPLGLMARQTVTSASGAIAAGPTIVNNIATFPFIANRNYRLVWDSSWLYNDLQSLFYCSIGTCSTADPAAQTTGIATINGRTHGALANTTTLTSQYTGMIVAHYKPATTGALQVKFMVQRVLGSGSILVGGNANETAEYLIYDDGAVI